MENFADFLPFSEEVQEAFGNYHIEAATLTISELPKDIGCVIGRVVWRSPLLKIGCGQDTCVLHITMMDAKKVEITGTAWGKVAEKFDEILEKDKIYKFLNAVTFSKSSYKAVKNDHFDSRVTKQTIELRFSQVIEPQLVCQNPFPDIDQSQFRTDYHNIQFGHVTSIVGLVTHEFLYNGNIYICFANGEGYSIGVFFEPAKIEEIKAMNIKKRFTVMGVLGVQKIEDIDTKTIGDKAPKALYKTFDDSVLFDRPLCEGTRHLVTWRNELVTEDAEAEPVKAI